MAASTAISPVGKNEGNSENQENDTSNERHFERQRAQTIDGVGRFDDEPEREKREEKKLVRVPRRV